MLWDPGSLTTLAHWPPEGAPGPQVESGWRRRSGRWRLLRSWTGGPRPRLATSCSLAWSPGRGGGRGAVWGSLRKYWIPDQGRDPTSCQGLGSREKGFGVLGRGSDPALARAWHWTTPNSTRPAWLKAPRWPGPTAHGRVCRALEAGVRGGEDGPCPPCPLSQSCPLPRLLDAFSPHPQPSSRLCSLPAYSPLWLPIPPAIKPGLLPAALPSPAHLHPHHPLVPSSSLRPAPSLPPPRPLPLQHWLTAWGLRITWCHFQ